MPGWGFKPDVFPGVNRAGARGGSAGPEHAS